MKAIFTALILTLTATTVSAYGFNTSGLMPSMSFPEKPADTATKGQREIKN